MCTAECYMKGKKSKGQNWEIYKSRKMPEKRCIKASTIQYTPDCGRDTEVNDDYAFILQLIILKSYLTRHRLCIHKWEAFAPVTVSTIHYCIPFHQPRFSVSKGVRRITVTVFCIQKCTPLHRSQFYYPELHTVSSLMVSKRFSTHGFQYRKLITLSPVMVCRIHDCMLPHQ
jgi:hypothetical protein